jgi:hypothetical protein
MARARGAERGPPTLHRTLFTPGVYLWRMFVFLVLVGLLIAVLHKPLEEALLNNPGLNGLILVVLFAGTLYSFQQVLRLYPEIRWVNAFRIADPGLAISHRPVLLAPMATMLRDRTGSLSLSATSMRSIMDSIGGRLDEARDTGRYLVGLLVFLGLLGTFWGLLDTISSVGRTIAALDTKGESSLMFDELKTGLAAPLRGMGTAFSSSLLGLGGSLVLGFLELQASHAHGRFYNQLEEWLSGITELAPAGGGQAGDFASQQLYAAIHDMHRAVLDLGDRIAAVPRTGEGPGPEEAVKDLAKGVDQLVRQMRAEQKVVREWVDEQAAQQSEVASVLKELASTVHRK